ncbi:MAG: class I SAM-dependent methyltransferase, partial [Streptosporangiaceae bacterium]
LAHEASPAFLAGGAVITRGWFAGIDRLAQAFRTGAGIPWHDQDPAVYEGTERFFRPGYTASLTTEWVPALPGIPGRLAAGGRAADVGCGHGAAAILLARAFPRASVHGYDFHDRSVQVARQRAAQAGLGDRIRFEALDATSYPAGGYHLICLLDTLHDLGDPAAALAHARKALSPDGAVLLVEPAADDDYQANLASPMAPLSYAASTFQCTPAALAQPGGTALGAQAGPAAALRLADDAGFTRRRQVTQTPVNVVLELRPEPAPPPASRAVSPGELTARLSQPCEALPGCGPGLRASRWTGSRLGRRSARAWRTR